MIKDAARADRRMKKNSSLRFSTAILRVKEKRRGWLGVVAAVVQRVVNYI